MPCRAMQDRQAMVHVIRLVSFLWLWFQSVCLLVPSLSTYPPIAVSLTLDMGCLLTATTPDLGCGYLLSVAHHSSTVQIMYIGRPILCICTYINIQSELSATQEAGGQKGLPFTCRLRLLLQTMGREREKFTQGIEMLVSDLGCNYAPYKSSTFIVAL